VHEEEAQARGSGQEEEVQAEEKVMGRLLSALVLVTVAALVLASAAQAVTIPFERTLTDTSAPPGIRTGKLFLTLSDGSQKDCSASSVDAPNRSTLITAAHCVFPNSRLGLAASATFAPGYHDGDSPYGQYFSRQIAVPPLWIAGRSHFDYAFIVVGRSGKGRAVQDVVGANPIAFNQPRQQAYRLIGYPNDPDPPFTGQTSWKCNTAWGGESYAPAPNQSDPPTILAGCDMGEGSSGGPWLTDQGVVASVTHTAVPGSPNVLGGPTLDDAAAALFASVNTISTATHCKKKKGHKSAVAAKKKCKRKHRHH
jgi:V8-like Glu-specific endopeptidase